MTPAEIIEGLLVREGPFVDNKDDSGGKTAWGLTEAVARENGFGGDMRLLGKEFARSVYWRKYIEKPGFALLIPLSPRIAEEVIDTGVNAGVYAAGVMLQRALNVFNLREAYYKDLKVDGEIGSGSRGALKAFLARRGKAGEVVMLKALNILQGALYFNLAETRQKDETFIYGWIDNRIAL